VFSFFQGNKGTGEMLTNMQFLLSVVNDAHRIVTKLVFSLISSTPALASTEPLLAAIYNEFTRIIQVGCRLLCRCLFQGLTASLVDYDSLWAGGTDVLRSITTTLNYSLRDIERCSETACYVRLLGTCADICAVRLLLMLRDRANASSSAISGGSTPAGNAANINNKFSASELERLLDNISHFISVFECSGGLQLLSNTSGEGCQTESDPLASHLNQYEVFASTKLCTAVANIQDLKTLLTTSYETEAFSNAVRAVVRRYRIAAVASTYLNVAGPFLNVVVCSLRPDTCAALVTLTTVILENHGSRLSGAETHLAQASAASSRRMADNASFSSTFSGGAPSATGAGSRSPNITGFEATVDFCDDPISRVFGSKVNLDDLECASGSTSTVPTTPMKPKAKPLISTPFTLKQLREKTSDVISNVLTHNRKNADPGHAADLMRLLGLEEDFGIGHHISTDDYASISTARHTSASNIGEDVGGPSPTADGVTAARSVSAITFSVDVSNIKLRGISSSSLFSGANPYVAISMGSLREKTPVAHNVSSCEWPSTNLSFRGVSPSCNSLTVQVFDKEIVRRKRLLGSVTVSMLGVDARPIQSWFALEGGEGTGAGKAEIYLRIQLLQ
jgi:hypothetical protein